MRCQLVRNTFHFAFFRLIVVKPTGKITDVILQVFIFVVCFFAGNGIFAVDDVPAFIRGQIAAEDDQTEENVIFVFLVFKADQPEFGMEGRVFPLVWYRDGENHLFQQDMQSARRDFVGGNLSVVAK